MSATALMTVEEFAEMETADTERYELVEGELIPLSSPTPRHNKIRARVERSLENYFERNPIGEVFGETDCRLLARTVRKPDAAVFIGEQLRLVDQYKAPAPFAPGIAVEVLSPSEKAGGLHRKIGEYLAGGSHEVWVLDDANGEIFVHTNHGIRLLKGADTLESPLLPGFAVTVGKLFD